ncbi:MAG: hypothetical protein H7068_11010 [Pedobacter sp.]|nr:hypothetical protein [Chitinophagaceae bacterium]
MMENLDFDNYVKAKLHNHKSPVPKGLWDKILVDQPTKKPLVFWWLNNKMYLLTAACLLLISGTYFIIQNKEQLNFTSQNAKITPINLKLNNTNSITNKTENVIAKNAVLNNNNTTSTTNNDLLNGNNQSQFWSADKSTISNSYSNKTVTNNNLISNPNSATTQLPTILLLNDDAFLVTHFTKEKTVLLANLSELEAKNPTSLQLSNNKQIFGLDCPNALPTKWYLEAYGSPDYIMKNVYAKGVSDAYLQRIDSTTKMNGGFTFGLRISKSINDRILIKSGLQYSQRNEQFISKSDSIITTTNVVTVRTIVRGGGLSDTMVRDTSSLQQIGYKKRITNNQYKSIEVPLMLSYERGNDKWRLALNGGIIVNLSSWYSGETLDTSYQLVPLSAKNGNGFYKSNLNVSLYAGVSIFRRINKNLEAFAEPYFRYGLSNSNTSAIGYNQRFNAAGLSLGIRIKLNKSSSNKL